MPLIIETYNYPYYKISDILFPGQDFTYLDKPISEGSTEQFCFTRKELIPEEILYYFNRIYYIEKDKIVAIDKSAQKIKYYDLKTGKLVRFEESVKEPVVLNNNSNLPQLYAQNGEIVLFPDNEEDD